MEVGARTGHSETQTRKEREPFYIPGVIARKLNSCRENGENLPLIVFCIWAMKSPVQDTGREANGKFFF